MIVAPLPPAALTASPARIELSGAGTAVIRVANPGRSSAVVAVSRAGFGLDLHGRPRIVVRRDPSVRVSVAPGRVVLRPGGAASIVVSSALGPRARPGDHELLVLLATRRLAGAGISARMQVGVVVDVRVPGVVVRRLDVRQLRVLRRGRLEVLVRNGGDVVERISARTLRIVLRRGGRVLAKLQPMPRELLPGARGIVEARYPPRIRGRARATVLIGRRAVVYRIRLP